MNDPRRFLDAQDGGVYENALEEIRAGEKRGHWMWFVFPQIAGLGCSEMSRFYAIADRDEALAYAIHPILGPRLAECASAMTNWAGKRDLIGMLGPVDALKFRSSMTLFEAAAPRKDIFATALDQLCDGARDGTTLERL